MEATLTAPVLADPVHRLSSQIARAHRKETPGRTRVLVVAFQTGKQADGGTESLTQLLERYERTRVTVLTQKDTAKTQRWLNAGHTVQVTPLPYEPGAVGGGTAGKLARVWHHLKWNLTAAWMALREGVAVAHINDPHALWHTGLGLRLAGVPIVYNLRDTKPSLTAREVWKWRVGLGLTQSQIVLSREMGAFWRRAVGRPLRTLHAIYSVVDFEKMQPLSGEARARRRRELGISDGWAVGYVASFSPKKGQRRFLELGRAGLERLPGSGKVYFLGDFEPAADPYAAQCADAAKGLEGRVYFQGFVKDVERWYPALDAVVVATVNEGLARCMIEGLACGTPVVSFDVCSAREILEGNACGVVVRQGDYDGILGALGELLAATERARELGTRGARAARVCFDAKANTRAYEEHYLNLSERKAAI